MAESDFPPVGPQDVWGRKLIEAIESRTSNEALAEKLTEGPVAAALSGTIGASIDNKMPDGLDGWRLALANRGYARAEVTCVGDSITEGVGADFYGQGWVQQLQSQLRARLGVEGGAGFIPARLTDAQTMPHPGVLTGDFYPNAEFGPKRYSVLLNGDTKITYAVVGTAIDVIATAGSATGEMQISIDGGAPVIIQTADPILTPGKRYRVNLGASGAHTIEIQHGPTAGPDVYLDGIIAYDLDEDAGVGVYDAGHSGWTSESWASNRGYWPTSQSNAFNADLVIISLGYNDCWNWPTPYVAPAQFGINLRAMIDSVRSDYDNQPSILIHSYPPRSGTLDHWNQYVEEMKSAAADKGTAIFDQAPRWPAGNDWDSGFYRDGTHPLPKGHAALADSLASFLMPR